VKLKEIAERINAHIKRFEADPIINAGDRKYKSRPYYHAHVHERGNRVFVQYVSYQGPTSLSKERALAYLQWLDNGNVGRHFEAEKEA